MASHYAQIERAIAYLQTNASEQPNLSQIAAEIGLSDFHFQRLFRDWAGVTPKRFLQCLTIDTARRMLSESRTVLETSHAVGLSGGGRLHDLFVRIERMTPGEYKAGGNLQMHWDIAATIFGPALFACTERGLCALSFVASETSLEDEIPKLQQRWPAAILSRDPAKLAPYVDSLNKRLQGQQCAPLAALVSGTDFQVQVWEALLHIPYGAVVDYKHVATAIEKPGAVRAVASAIGANQLAILIPCHRVIRGSGAISGYRWGSARKRALIALERSRTVLL